MTLRSGADSTIILMLLVLSGVSAYTAAPVMPVNAVTVGAGTLSLGQSSGVPVWNAFYKDFGDWITVTGTGFPSNQNDIQLVMIRSTTAVTATVAADCAVDDSCDLGSNTLDNTAQGYFDPSIAGANFGTVMSDANGWFKAQFATPVVQEGSYIVYAVYPTLSGNVVTTSVPFTVNAAISVVSDFTGTAGSSVGDAIQLSGVGFDNAEQLQAIPSSFFTNALHPLILTGNTPGVNEGAFDDGPETTTNTNCAAANGPYCVGSLVGGSHSVTILGLSSGNSVSVPYTINPTLYLKDPTCATPVFSIDTVAGAKVCVTGSGFAQSSVIAPAGTVTIGGVSTIHGEIDSDANGHFSNVVVTLTMSSVVGLVNVGLGGTTFNYATGNIFQPNANLFDYAAGVLVGSHAGQGALMTLPEGTSRRVGQSGTLIGFGYNAKIAYGSLGPFVLKDKSGNSHSFLTPAAVNGGDAADALGTDANGAFVYWYTTPTIQHLRFTLHDSTASNPAPDSLYTINPDVRSGSNVASAGDELTLLAGSHGGLDTQAGLTNLGVSSPPLGDLTVFVNGDLWDSCVHNAGLCDSNIAGNGAFVTDVHLAPLGGAGITSTDLPMGTYSVNITGTYGGDWAFGRFQSLNDPAAGTYTQLTIDPIVLSSALSTAVGPSGTVVTIRTGAIGSPAPGVHGLAAGTQYKVMWDGTTQVGSFTSTVEGGVPVGTQFTVPAGTPGVHVVDLQTTGGTSALWGQIEDHQSDQFANMEFTLTAGSTTTVATSTITSLTTVTSTVSLTSTASTTTTRTSTVTTTATTPTTVTSTSTAEATTTVPATTTFTTRTATQILYIITTVTSIVATQTNLQVATVTSTIGTVTTVVSSSSITTTISSSSSSSPTSTSSTTITTKSTTSSHSCIKNCNVGGISLSTLGAEFDSLSALATPYLSQALVGVVAGLFVYFLTRRRTKEA